MLFLPAKYIVEERQEHWRRKKFNDLSIAHQNLLALDEALRQFHSDYNGQPSASTGVMIKERTGSTWTFRDSTSTDLFRQLFATGILKSEVPFYAKTPWSKKPDNRFSREELALSAGECAISYIPDSSFGHNWGAPILLVPLEPGKLTFDPEVFNGVAVVRFSDGTQGELPIDPSGRAILNGMDLFDPRQPFWHGKDPVVKWPK